MPISTLLMAEVTCEPAPAAREAEPPAALQYVICIACTCMWPSYGQHCSMNSRANITQQTVRYGHDAICQQMQHVLDCIQQRMFKRISKSFEHTLLSATKYMLHLCTTAA